MLRERRLVSEYLPTRQCVTVLDVQRHHVQVCERARVEEHVHAVGEALECFGLQDDVRYVVLLEILIDMCNGNDNLPGELEDGRNERICILNHDVRRLPTTRLTL